MMNRCGVVFGRVGAADLALGSKQHGGRGSAALVELERRRAIHMAFCSPGAELITCSQTTPCAVAAFAGSPAGCWRHSVCAHKGSRGWSTPARRFCLSSASWIGLPSAVSAWKAVRASSTGVAKAVLAAVVVISRQAAGCGGWASVNLLCRAAYGGHEAPADQGLAPGRLRRTRRPRRGRHRAGPGGRRGGLAMSAAMAVAEAVAGAGRGLAAPEAPQRRGPVLGGDAGAVVLDLDPGLGARCCHSAR